MPAKRQRVVDTAAPELVDREGELGTLSEVLAAARAGHGAAVLVEGAAGIGKTSLLTAARAEAEWQGMTTLRGRGTDLERDFPFGVVRQCLEPFVGHGPDASRWLRGAAGLAAQVLLAGPEPSGASPAGLLHGLYWLLANIASDAPVLMTIDDGHWVDEPSLRFISYLARRIDSLPVALMMAAQPVHGTDELSTTVIAELAADPDTRRIEPLALSPAGVERVLARSTGETVDRDFADACSVATGGNPFLLGELARALYASGAAFSAARADEVRQVTPPALARSATVTLARLGSDATALARSAALLGDGAPLELVGALAGVPIERVAPAAGALSGAGILADTADVRFRHPILLGAVRDGQSQHERAAGHLRAADLLRERGVAPERVALQLVHATPRGDRRAVLELAAAAEQARRRGAPQTASAMLRRALEEPPAADERAAILLELGQAELAAGATAEAGAHFDEAYRCAGDVTTRARALPPLTQVHRGDAYFQENIECRLTETLREAGDLDDELVLRLRATQLLGGVAFDGPLPAGETRAEAVLLGHLVFARMTPDAVADDVAEIATRGARRGHEVAEEDTSRSSSSCRGARERSAAVTR